MASMKIHSLVLVLVALVMGPLAAVAGDPDILTDFVPPTTIGGPANITGDYFTFTGFRPKLIPTATFAVEKASLAEFPALNGQSVSYARLTFPAGTVNPTHTHPRASELLLVIEGALSVGFIDTAGKLYTKDLVAGDMFVFPKGLVHYQSNQGANLAVALSGFGSASAGTVSVPLTVFGTGIDDVVLAKSFKTDVATVQKLKAALTPPKKN
ncbi:germin-like protein 9-3 [Lolium rigidum]|uniref:germin-like protein 9-3 n=1 Tax=Lolium rigidum TaxID=89674 RepID=UPI001F5CFEA3|nr:germin-like protein 9-3 [Lolium rigidum]